MWMNEMNKNRSVLDLCRLVVRARWWLLAFIVVVVSGLGWGASRTIPPDNSLRVWFPDDDPSFLAYDAYQAEWGNDEVIFVHLDFDRDVFEADVLEHVSELANELASIEQVARIYSVLDLLHLTDVVGKPPADFNDVKPTRAERERAAQIAARDPLVRGVVVGKDRRQLALVIEPHVTETFDVERDDLIREVRRICDQHAQRTGIPARLAGTGVIYQALNEATAEDFALFLGVGFLLLLLALGLLSRSWEVVLAAASVITIGVLAALGLYGWAGHRLNLVTALIPTLVMVLGVADVVHFPAALRRARRAHRAAAPDEVAAQALALALAPCVLTTVATAGGFLSLLSSPIPALRHLGIYAAVGVGSSLLACIVLMSFVSIRLAKRPETVPPYQIADRLLRAVRSVLMRHARPAWLVVALGSAVLAVGALQLEVDTNTLGYLPDSHRAVEDHHRIEDRWGPFYRLEMIAELRDDGRVTDDEKLRQLHAFASQAVEHPEVQSVVYLGTVYEHAVLNHRGPDARVRQGDIVGLQRDAGAAHPDGMGAILRPVLSADETRARLVFTTSIGSARMVADTIASVEAIAQETAPDFRVTAVGYPPLYVEIIDQVMVTLQRGFLLALLIIFLVLTLWLRSWRLVAASLVANLFPVLAIFGVMGWLGIDLDIGTAMIVSIVLSVAVDDTIHFLHAWRVAAREGLPWSGAVDHAFHAAGRAAVVTSLLLLAGFPVLMLSQVTTVYTFGLLTTIAAIAALAADLVLLPLTLRLLGSPCVVAE